MKLLWILLFIQLHYGLTRVRSVLRKRGQVRSKITRPNARSKICNVGKGNAHLRKTIRQSKICTDSVTHPGSKRNLIYPPSRFDESREFGRFPAENAARRSFFRNTESMLPYPPLLNGPMSTSAFRNRDVDEGDGPEELDEREEESRRFPPDLRQQTMRSLSNFAPFPFMNPARDAMPGPFERDPSSFGRSPVYPQLMNPYHGVTDSRNMMPNGNYPGGEQLENDLENYMYKLSVARAPHRSSLNIPGEFARPQPDLTSIPNSDLMFPPLHGMAPHDQTVVPNAMPNMDVPPQSEMQMAPRPQGTAEMQVAPRPLDAPFFMAQRDSDIRGGPYRRGGMMGQNNVASRYRDMTGKLYRRGDLIGPGNLESNYDKMVSPLRKVTEDVPDVMSSLNSIFNDIESDEKEYKENVGNKLTGQRKDVVQRRNFGQQEDYSPPNYRALIQANYRTPIYNRNMDTGSSRTPMYNSNMDTGSSRTLTYNSNMDTGSSEQNELERKYEVVLNSLANTDAFLRQRDGNANFPGQMSTDPMEALRNEQNTLNERSPFYRDRRPFEMTPMDGYSMLPER